MSSWVRREKPPRQTVAISMAPSWLNEAAQTAHLRSVHRRLATTPSPTAMLNPWLAEFRQRSLVDQEKSRVDVDELKEEIKRFASEIDRLRDAMESRRDADGAQNAATVTALENALEKERQMVRETVEELDKINEETRQQKDEYETAFKRLLEEGKKYRATIQNRVSEVAEKTNELEEERALLAAERKRADELRLELAERTEQKALLEQQIVQLLLDGEASAEEKASVERQLEDVQADIELSKKKIEEAREFIDDQEQVFAELADKNIDILESVRDSRLKLTKEVDLYEKLLENGGSFQAGGGRQGSADL